MKQKSNQVSRANPMTYLEFRREMHISKTYVKQIVSRVAEQCKANIHMQGQFLGMVHYMTSSTKITKVRKDHRLSFTKLQHVSSLVWLVCWWIVFPQNGFGNEFPKSWNLLISKKGECFAPHLIFACQKWVPPVEFLKFLTSLQNASHMLQWASHMLPLGRYVCVVANSG